MGGAAGAYSKWLAGEGYETHLLDPVPEHLRAATDPPGIETSPPVASILRADGRALPWRGESADAVLLMGPMYHLPVREDRRKVLGEARRVLKNGGVMFAAGINRFASLLDGLFFGLVDDPYFAGILADDLDSGVHRNPERHPDYFTTAVFHRPTELAEEVCEAGFTVRGVVPIEGPAWLASDFEARWSDGARREQLLSLVHRTEGEPTLLGASPHFMVVAEK
ncbi:MAG: class I SAM-dependent methyltransferase [Planctomycetota bacterium]